MKVSDKGLALIKEFEGCKLTAYQDSVGVWTIGYGHTKTARLNGKTLTEFVTALFVCVTIRMGWGTKQIIAFGGWGTGMCLMEMGFDGNLY